MNDSELYSRTLVLTIALTDLGEMYVEEGGKIVMEGVKSLGRVLKEIEQRIREYPLLFFSRSLSFVLIWEW